MGVGASCSTSGPEETLVVVARGTTEASARGRLDLAASLSSPATSLRILGLGHGESSQADENEDEGKKQSL